MQISSQVQTFPVRRAAGRFLAIFYVVFAIVLNEMVLVLVLASFKRIDYEREREHRPSECARAIEDNRSTLSGIIPSASHAFLF